MARKHKLEEVLQALKNKGCVITGNAPITAKHEIWKSADEKQMDEAFARWCKYNRKDADIMSRVEWESKPQIQRMLLPRLVTVTSVTQPPYTINWKDCQLGNGSWGKIDYLVKVHGYRVMPNVY